jgi:hypothetical protein
MITYFHKHHIIPKHAGGSDDPSNIVKLTVEEHAEAHRILFEKYGRWQDYAAWQGLSKQVDNQEMRRLVASLSAQERMRKLVSDGKHHWLGGEIHRAKVANGTHHCLGGHHAKKLVAEGKHNFVGGEIQRKSNRKRIAAGTHNLLGPTSNQQRLSQGTHPSQMSKTCEHCGKTVSVGMFARWHGSRCKFRS